MKPGDIVIVQPNMIHQLGMEKGSQAIVFNTIGRNPIDPDYEHHTSFIMK